MSSIEPLQSVILDLPPCCIEVYPDNPQYAVIGTYNLEKEDGDQPTEEGQRKSQQRNGSLILIKIAGDEVELVQTLPTPSAILDVHFHPTQKSLLGVATSTGSIGIYKIQEDAGEVPKLARAQTIQYFTEDVLVTAFSWHPNGNTVGMTLSSGTVHLGSYSNENQDEAPRSVEVLAHNLEAWTLAYLPYGSGLFSGGDDRTLRFTELPANPIEALEGGDLELEYLLTRRAPWADTRIHGAGVTGILPVHCDEAGMFVVTGSYDDHIRLVHINAMGRRQVLSELSLGGGVWRLKVLASTQRSANFPEEILLLVSCMHAGARIVRLSRREEVWRFEILAKFEEHKSMNYGSDAQPDVNEKGQRTFVSTSFYDRLLCLWRY